MRASFVDIMITAVADLNAQDICGRAQLHSELIANGFGQIEEELTKALVLTSEDAHIHDQYEITPRALMH